MLIYGGGGLGNTSNTAILAVASDGTVQIKSATAETVYLDLQGYFTSDDSGIAPGGFVPVDAKRILDTATGVGVTKARLAPGDTIAFQVGGTASVPIDASAVAINITVTNRGSNAGYVTPFPTGGSRPNTSLNYPGGNGIQTGIGAQVALSADGQMSISNPAAASSTIDLWVDIQGFFTASEEGGIFTPGTGRVLDTRVSPNTAIAGGDTLAVQVAGVRGVPVSGSGVSAVVLSITALRPQLTAGGYARVWADGDTEPATTSINYAPNSIRTNTITVPLGDNGKVVIRNKTTDAVNFVLDVQGWYQDIPLPKISCNSPATDGYWSLAPITTTTACQVVAPPVSMGDGVLSLVVDGEDQDDVLLSDQVTTTKNISIAAGPGAHHITASVRSDSLDRTREADYDFGSGDWSKANIIPSLPNGANSNSLTPTLTIGTDAAPFAENVKAKFSLSGNPDGSAPILTTDSTFDPFAIPSGLLNAGSTYYWHADISGPNNTKTATANVSTPWWSFTATVDPDAAAVSSNSTSSTRARKPVVSTKGITGPECGLATLIIVRGSNEGKGSKTLTADGYAYASGGYGRLGVLVTQFLRDPTFYIYAESLKYPANIAPSLSSLGYADSLNYGTSNLVGALKALAKRCPHSNILLAGYSQGAQVIGRVLSSPTSSILGKSVTDKIAAVVLEGDPTYYRDEAIDAAGSGTGQGLLNIMRKRGSMDGWKGTRAGAGLSTTKLYQSVRSYCYAGDYFCQTNLTSKGSTIHGSYGTQAQGKRMHDYIVSFLYG